MKTKLIALFMPLIVLSCQNRAPNVPEKPAVPKALNNESSPSFNSISKRGNDLVAELYAELAEQTPELKNMELKLEHLRENKDDSTYDFGNYDQKNNSYYATAESMTYRFSDSVLAKKVRQIISTSIAKYKLKSEEHRKLSLLIDSNMKSLDDLHAVLKITRTLTLIEQYQNTNKPSIVPLKHYSVEVKQAMNEVDLLIKK